MNLSQKEEIFEELALRKRLLPVETKEIIIGEQDIESELSRIRKEKDLNYKEIEAFKLTINELRESKLMLREEITVQLLSRAELLGQIEWLELRLEQMKRGKSVDIGLFLEERGLRAKLEETDQQMKILEAEESQWREQIGIMEGNLKGLKEKKRYSRLEVDLKAKEKEKRFVRFMESWKEKEERLMKKLEELGVKDEVYGVLNTTSQTLIGNIDEMSIEDIKGLLTAEKLLEDIRRLFEQRSIDPGTLQSLEEEIQDYYSIFTKYALFHSCKNAEISQLETKTKALSEEITRISSILDALSSKKSDFFAKKTERKGELTILRQKVMEAGDLLQSFITTTANSLFEEELRNRQEQLMALQQIYGPKALKSQKELLHQHISDKLRLGLKLRLDQIGNIDNEIMTLKEKVRLNSVYVEQELIEITGDHLERRLMEQEERLREKRNERVGILQKENETMVMKRVKLGEELMSFKPKNKIAVMLQSLSSSIEDPSEKQKYEVRILEDLILSREDEIIELTQERDRLSKDLIILSNSRSLFSMRIAAQTQDLGRMHSLHDIAGFLMREITVLENKMQTLGAETARKKDQDQPSEEKQENNGNSDNVEGFTSNRVEVKGKLEGSMREITLEETVLFDIENKAIRLVPSEACKAYKPKKGCQKHRKVYRIEGQEEISEDEITLFEHIKPLLSGQCLYKRFSHLLKTSHIPPPFDPQHPHKHGFGPRCLTLSPSLAHISFTKPSNDGPLKNECLIPLTEVLDVAVPLETQRKMKGLDDGGFLGFEVVLRKGGRIGLMAARGETEKTIRGLKALVGRKIGRLAERIRSFCVVEI